MVISAGSAQAESRGHGCSHKEWDSAKQEEHIQHKVEKLTKKFDLTADQQPRVEAALRTKVEKKQAITTQMHEQMTALRDEYKAQMGAILNPEQQAAFDEWHAEHAKHAACKHHRRWWKFWQR